MPELYALMVRCGREKFATRRVAQVPVPFTPPASSILGPGHLGLLTFQHFPTTLSNRTLPQTLLFVQHEPHCVPAAIPIRVTNSLAGTASSSAPFGTPLRDSDPGQSLGRSRRGTLFCRGNHRMGRRARSAVEVVGRRAPTFCEVRHGGEAESKRIFVRKETCERGEIGAGRGTRGARINHPPSRRMNSFSHTGSKRTRNGIWALIRSIPRTPKGDTSSPSGISRECIVARCCPRRAARGNISTWTLNEQRHICTR